MKQLLDYTDPSPSLRGRARRWDDGINDSGTPTARADLAHNPDRETQNDFQIDISKLLEYKRDKRSVDKQALCLPLLLLN